MKISEFDHNRNAKKREDIISYMSDMHLKRVSEQINIHHHTIYNLINRSGKRSNDTLLLIERYIIKQNEYILKNIDEMTNIRITRCLYPYATLALSRKSNISYGSLHRLKNNPSKVKPFIKRRLIEYLRIKASSKIG